MIIGKVSGKKKKNRLGKKIKAPGPGIVHLAKAMSLDSWNSDKF